MHVQLCTVHNVLTTILKWSSFLFPVDGGAISLQRIKLLATPYNIRSRDCSELR